MKKLKILDLFSGIGGFTIASQMSNPEAFETIAYCEIDKEARKVLELRFPGKPIFEDVRSVTVESIRERCGNLPDIICGGFPCQNLSCAGAQVGIYGEQSKLFFEIIRLASELRPKYLFMENVAALLSSNGRSDMDAVLGALATIGYDAEWDCIQAFEVGAVHKRDRIWIVAYPSYSDKASYSGLSSRKTEKVSFLG